MKSNRFNLPSFTFGPGLGRLIHGAFEGLEDLGGLFANSPLAPSAGPPTELFEDEHHYHARFELPGVKKSDLKVELADGTLKVAASVTKETREGRKNFPVERSVSLPDKIGEGELRAKFEDGILTVSLPKAEEAKPRSITIE